MAPGVGGLEDGARPGAVTACSSASSPGPRVAGPEGTILTLGHAVQDHVNEDVGASPPCTITETGIGTG